MRSAVLDIGSNSAHLVIADLKPGLPPGVVRSVKTPVRLAEAADADGRIHDVAVRRVVAAVAEAVAATEVCGVEDLTIIATSAIRDATNQEEIAAAVLSATGVRLGYLSGEEEARLTFLAVRRWYGWSAGRITLLDIGGGSMELATGEGETPEIALSLPLGAGRLTRHHLPGDPPSRKDVKRLRRHVKRQLAEAAPKLTANPPRLAIATSRIFHQLGRLTGAPRDAAGPYATRLLHRRDLRVWIPRLAEMTVAERADLRGVSNTRARQILAGAIVAQRAMKALNLRSVRLCPWALREGILLSRLERSQDLTSTTAPLTPYTPNTRSLHTPSTPTPGGSTSHAALSA